MTTWDIYLYHLLNNSVSWLSEKNFWKSLLFTNVCEILRRWKICALLSTSTSPNSTHAAFVLDLARTEEAVAPHLIDDRDVSSLDGLVRGNIARERIVIMDYDVTGYTGGLVNDLADFDRNGYVLIYPHLLTFQKKWLLKTTRIFSINLPNP